MVYRESQFRPIAGPRYSEDKFRGNDVSGFISARSNPTPWKYRYYLLRRRLVLLPFADGLHQVAGA